MKLTTLYSQIEKEKIDIFNWKMNNTKARITYDEDYTIFIDYSRIHSYVEEKELLAEELGHYKCCAFYSILSDQNFINKQEFKARKWKALTLCPPKSILNCLKRRDNKFIRYCRKSAN